MTQEQEIRPGDSVAWNSAAKGAAGGTLAWGLVDSVNADGTLTVLAGAYRQRLTRHPDDIARHEPGPERFYRVYPGSQKAKGRRRLGRGRARDDGR